MDSKTTPRREGEVPPDYLRAALAARGVTQRELGHRLDRSVSTVERWCNGHLPIDRVTWLATLTALDLPRGWTPPREVP